MVRPACNTWSRGWSLARRRHRLELPDASSLRLPTALMRAPVVLLVAAVQVADLDTRDGWSAYSYKAGITLERRKVEGSKFYEHARCRPRRRRPGARGRADLGLGARRRHGEPEAAPILAERPDELVIYDQISTPVVSDRDYTIVVRGGNVGARVSFECGRPTIAARRRSQGLRAHPVGARRLVRSSPTARAAPGSATSPTANPGGAVPAWLVRGAQADRSVADVVRMVKRLRDGAGR